MPDPHIHLLDFEIVENPPYVEAKWLITVRFIDTNNVTGYDKCFSIAGNRLKDMLPKANYQCSVVCSIKDPYDIPAVTEAFKEYWRM